MQKKIIQYIPRSLVLAFKMIKYFLKSVGTLLLWTMPSNPKWALWSDKFKRHSSAPLYRHSAQKSSRPRQLAAHKPTKLRGCTETKTPPTLWPLHSQIQYTQRPTQDRYTPPFFKNKSVICLMYKCAFPAWRLFYFLFIWWITILI